MYKLINLTYSSEQKLYYKTMGRPEIETFINLINLDLWNKNLSKGLVTGEEVDYREIVRKEDMAFLTEQLGRQEQLNLDSGSIKNKQVIITKKLPRGVHQISQPIYNKNRTFSLILRNKHNGGKDILVYQRITNGWRVHSVITLSMV